MQFNEATCKKVNFVQDNHNNSTKNVLSGLHYQIQNPKGKLVSVRSGEVFDVAVDIRKSSTTYGQWVGVILSGENKKQLWVPEGFAHVFLTISDSSEFLYKTTDYYSPQYELAILWSDSEINIKWPLDSFPSLSTKDLQARLFVNAEVFV